MKYINRVFPICNGDSHSKSIQHQFYNFQLETHSIKSALHKSTARNYFRIHDNTSICDSVTD